MGSDGQKLLDRMRASKSGWKRTDLDKLYLAFGFVIIHGAKHDIVKHPKYLFLRATIPRHNEIATGYIQYAIKLIDRMKEEENG